MIEKIPDLPDNVLGFAAKGTVTAKDYETVIIPQVETMFSRQNKVRFLYHLGEDFSGIDAAAAWDDTKLGLRHLTGWERVAVVSDVGWIRSAVRIFGLVIPGRVRVFHNRELGEAKRWIQE
ncbi:MAG TPA: STAS/SEC14 domain-containing protein [Burkholderiales bacterium]|nr:STAS/SEC14 domain-containing protein [Burkholderiales bacterium]